MTHRRILPSFWSPFRYKRISNSSDADVSNLERTTDTGGAAEVLSSCAQDKEKATSIAILKLGSSLKVSDKTADQ